MNKPDFKADVALVGLVPMSAEAGARESLFQQSFSGGNKPRQGHGDLEEGQFAVIVEAVNTLLLLEFDREHCLRDVLPV